MLITVFWKTGILDDTAVFPLVTADSRIQSYDRCCADSDYNIAGKTFIVLSELLYMNYDIILFALEVEDLRNERSEKKILLNPADFVIPPKEDFKIQVQ